MMKNFYSMYIGMLKKFKLKNGIYLIFVPQAYTVCFFFNHVKNHQQIFRSLSDKMWKKQSRNKGPQTVREHH